jgi:HK97 family phage major capsid protein
MSMSGIENFALFTEQVDATIVRAMQPMIVHPDITRKVDVAKGNVREYNKLKVDYPFTVTNLSEGAEFPSNTLEFERKVVVLDEKGIAPRISKRQIEDGEFDVIQLTLEEIGFAMARQMNIDCLQTFDSGVPSGNIVNASAVWGSQTADPLKDVGDAMAKIENYNYTPKAMVMHPKVYNNLRLDPNFMAATARGDRTVLMGDIQTLYGMKILRTTQMKDIAGASETNPSKVILCDSDFAANYYERQPLRTEQVDVPKLRAIDIIAYARYAFSVIRPNATAEITGVA